MFQWRKFSLIAAVPCILLCLAIAALFAPGESVSRLVLFFAVLTFGKAVYDVYKKEGEDKEGVKATPEVRSLPEFGSFDPPFEAFGVEVYNAGRNAVAIKRVALVVKTEFGEVSEFMRSESDASRSEKRLFEEASTLPESVSRLELGPNKHARFHLDRHTEWTVGRLLEKPGQSFWIVIESFIGEVARISGKDVQEAILNTPYGRAIRAVELRMAKGTYGDGD